MKTTKIISSDCQIVNGYLRSAIYDLTRQKYYLLQRFSNINELDNEIINFLEREEVILAIPSIIKNNFLPIDFKYDTNQIISACQIRYFGEFDITKITRLFCRDFSIIINDFKHQIKQTVKILESLLNEPINSVQLHIIDTSLDDTDFMQLREIILNFSFCVAYAYDSYFDYKSRTQDLSLNITFLPQKTIDERKNFFINIKSFSESKYHNMFYNQLLLIDKLGNLKNSLNNQIDFGSIINTEFEKLKQVILSDEFNYVWYVTKEMIDVCKDCEFRNLCCDDKLPLKRKDHEWFNTIECHYNPYISKWKNEDGFLTLTECGIISNANEFSMNTEKINKINKELWGIDE